MSTVRTTRHQAPSGAATRTSRRRVLTRAVVHVSSAHSQGEHLLHVLNTLGSRKVVLEAELREIDEDIAQNSCMARKYGDDFFTEGTARLAQTRAEKQQKLHEIEQQLVDTNTSVKQGKQLLGSLAENYGNMAPPTYLNPSPSPFPGHYSMPPPQHAHDQGSPGSPARILTTSPILADRRAH